jgi:catechol 2,3-dioxygenase-like lactoylglutathione lyase family enzyme
MDHALNALVSSYEQGKCNRRELLAALGALLAAGPPTEAAVASPELPVKCRELNHVTFRVKDLARSRQFYSRVLGLPLMWEDTGVCALGLGRGFLTLRQSSDSGFDHWCVGVQGFTRARATADDRSREPLRDKLKEEGFLLRQEGDDPTIYVIDPDGFAVQLEAPGFKVW